MAAPTKTALEAERERLRGIGYTEDDIQKILLQREVQRTSPAAAANSSGPQMPMAGVLVNASAVLSHARGTIPLVKENFANLSDGSLPRKSRAKSAAILAGVVVIVGFLGFVVCKEYQIHVVNAAITAAAQARQAEVDADVKEAQKAGQILKGKASVMSADDFGRQAFAEAACLKKADMDACLKACSADYQDACAKINAANKTKAAQ